MYPNLRIQLWKAGIRQNRLAKMIKMDETVLSRIVNGFREPSPEFRKTISLLLQSDEQWLFQMAASPADIERGPTDGKPATSDL
jgi:transcriptional regulator with XRE-family HTH domain